MAKGAHLTQQVKILIAQIHLSHPDWGATKMHEKLLEDLKSLGLDRIFGPNWPSVSTVQKELTDIRKRDEVRTPESKDLDNPWSLGTLGMKHEFELPSETIPVILAIKRSRDSSLNQRIKSTNEESRELHNKWKVPLDKIDKVLEQLKPFSVREAKWVARLFHVLKDKANIEEMGLWAHHYSGIEKVCEVANVKCDTSYSDIGIINGDFYTYLLWTVSGDMPNSQQMFQDAEIQIFGNALETIELTPMGWRLYGVWLNGIQNRSKSKKWQILSIEEQRDIATRLRAWVLNQEPVEEFMCPEELLKEVQYGYFGEL
ncbi:hypothetical protein ACFLXX_00675 [Chloroflexota bacterium]